MVQSELPLHSTAALAGLIESREASPVEVVEAYLQRIDDLDFKFNSFITVLRERALEEARQAEQEILAGNYRGPMHGIPVGVKDQIWTKGIRTTGGARITADFVPSDDATVVANLRNAGAILLGKTNLSEFAITGLTHRFSTPRNPWDLNISAGGSSGGSGAATAAFLCATSLGEDTGGSIRRPAAWCGIVGLRPGWGRVSRYGLMRGVWSMDTIGPISRTVEDAAITLSAIAGYDAKDPTTWNTPVPDYRQALDGDIKGLRVGVVTELLHSDMVEPDVADAVTAAAGTLAELGAEVEEVSIPLAAHANAISGTLLAVEPAVNMKDWVRERIHDFGHDNRVGLLTGSLVPAQAYLKAQKLRTMLREDVLAAFRTYDVLVMPTSGRQAVPLTEDPPGDQQGDHVAAALHAHQHLQPFKRAGHFRALRVRWPGSAGGPTGRRPARWGGYGVPGCPRLRAEHPLAYHETTDRRDLAQVQ